MNTKKLVALFVAISVSVVVVLSNGNVKTSRALADEKAGLAYKELTLENVSEQLLRQIDSEKITGISPRDAEDLSSLVTVNSDGTETLYLFGEPIKYVDAKTKEVKFIDNVIVDGGGLLSKTAYKNEGNSFDVTFPKDLGNGIELTENGYAFKMTPLSAEKSKPEKKGVAFRGNTEQIGVEYPDAYGNGSSLRYELQNAGLKESILLEKFNGLSEYKFEIEANGLVPNTEKGGYIEFSDKETGETVFVLNSIFIEDSYDGEYTEKERHITFDNYYTIEYAGGYTYLLTMVLDKTFLESSDTVYPVLIDPTVKCEFHRSLVDSVCTSGNPTYVDTTNIYLTALDSPYTAKRMSYVQIEDDTLKYKKWIHPDNLQDVWLYLDDADTPPSTSPAKCYWSPTPISYENASWNALTNALSSNPPATSYQYSGGTTHCFYIKEPMKQWLSNAMGLGGASTQRGLILAVPNNAVAGKSFRSTKSGGTKPIIAIWYYPSTDLPNGDYIIKNTDSNTHSNKFLSPDPAGSNRVKATTTPTVWTIFQQNDGSYKIFLKGGAGKSLYTYQGPSSVYAAVGIPALDEPWYLYKDYNGGYRIYKDTPLLFCLNIGFNDFIELDFMDGNNPEQSWEFMHAQTRYTATVNNYFDDGYVARHYGSVTNNIGNAQAVINGRTDAVKKRYKELLGLEITMGTAEHFESAIDKCKKSYSVAGSSADVTAVSCTAGKTAYKCVNNTVHNTLDCNINLRCNYPAECISTHPTWSCTNNSIADFEAFLTVEHGNPGNKTESYVYWLGHSTSLDDFGGLTLWLELGRANVFITPLYSDKTLTLMHELGHTFSGHHHFHENEIPGTNICQNPHCSQPDCITRPNRPVCQRIYCSTPPNQPRYEPCIMNGSGGWDISRSDVLCQNCKNDMTIHLNNHH